jgi:hypothetical protein
VLPRLRTLDVCTPATVSGREVIALLAQLPCVDSFWLRVGEAPGPDAVVTDDQPTVTLKHLTNLHWEQFDRSLIRLKLPALRRMILIRPRRQISLGPFEFAQFLRGCPRLCELRLAVPPDSFTLVEAVGDSGTGAELKRVSFLLGRDGYNHTQPAVVRRFADLVQTLQPRLPNLETLEIGAITKMMEQVRVTGLCSRLTCAVSKQIASLLAPKHLPIDWA